MIGYVWAHGPGGRDRAWDSGGWRLLMPLWAAVLVIGSMVASTPGRADGGVEWEQGGTFTRVGFGSHAGRAQRKADVGDVEAPERRKSRRVVASVQQFIEADVPQRRGSRKTVVSEEVRSKRRVAKGTRVASLGRTPEYSEPPKSLSGGGNISWVASAGCLASNLRSVISHIAQSYGGVRVNSTCRARAHNRRVGGAPRSYHLSGDAADIRISGNVRAAYAYLRSAVGGLKHYGGGLFHIDNGPRRPF